MSDIRFRAILDNSDVLAKTQQIADRFLALGKAAAINLDTASLTRASQEVDQLNGKLKGLNAGGFGLGNPAALAGTDNLIAALGSLEAAFSKAKLGGKQLTEEEKAAAEAARQAAAARKKAAAEAAAAEKLSAQEAKTAIDALKLSYSQARVVLDQKVSAANSITEVRAATQGYRDELAALDFRIQSVNEAQALSITQQKTLADLQARIAREQTTLQGRSTAVGLSANVAAGMNAADGSASAAKAKAVDNAVAHLNSTYAAGRITLKEYETQLAALNKTATADITAIEREIAALRGLGTMQETERVRLAELITQQKAYADSLINVAAAETRAAQAARERSASGGFMRGMGLNNAAMAASFISPEAGMIGMAASMGPVVAGAAGVGLAIKGVVNLTKSGQDEAKKWQQAFLVMSANGVKNLDEVKASIDSMAQSGSDAERMFSKGEMAQAMAELARGGVKGDEALKTIAVSARLAAAEHVPLNEATELLYANLQHLGMGGAEAALFGDQLARASHMSLASMDKLSKGMNVVGMTAHTMGFSTEETLAMLVQLAKKGMDPATIGATGLRNAMQMAIKPSEKAKLAYAAMGVALRDSNDHARSGHDIMMDLQKVMTATGPIYNHLTGKIMNQNDLAAASFQIFGTRSATAFLGLRGNLHELSEEIKDSHGFLATYADTVVGGLEGAQKRYATAVKNLSLMFAGTFTPALTTAIEWLTRFIKGIGDTAMGFNDLSKNGRLKDYFGDVAIGITGVGLAIAYVKAQQTGFLSKDIAQGFPAMMTAAKNGITALGPALATARTGMMGLVTAAYPLLAIAAATGFVLWIKSITDETKRAYAEIEQADLKSRSVFSARIANYAKAGDELGKLRAKYLLQVQAMTDAEDTGDEEAVRQHAAAAESLRQQMQQLTQEHQRHAVTVKSSAVAQKIAVKATEDQIAAYVSLGQKLDELKGKFAESKMTPFQKGLQDARHEVAALIAEIDKMVKKGQITPEQGAKRKKAVTQAGGEIADNLVNRQLTEDKKTIEGHQSEIESARLALIKDGAAKRRAEYDKEVTDLGSKYGPQITAALQNARTPGLSGAQRNQLLGVAGQLQQEQAEAVRAAQAKLNQDLAAINDERVKKERDSHTQSLQALASAMDGRTSILQNHYKQAQDAAEGDVAKRLEVEQTYAPRLEAMQKAARNAKLAADRQALQNQLQDDLKAAENQGSQTARLKYEANQRYLTNSRAMEAAYNSDIQGYHIATQQAIGKARADVTKKALDTEMQGIKQWTGAQLAAYGAVLQLKLKVAQAAGDGDRVKVLQDAIKAISDQQFTNITDFKKGLTEAGTSATDLRQKLSDLNPTKDILKGAQVSAAKPFDEVIKTARDKQKALSDAFQLLTPEQQAAQIGSYKSMMGDYKRISDDAAKQRGVAVLRATQDTQAKEAEGQLKLAEAQHAYTAALASSNAEVVAGKQQAIADSQKEIDLLAQKIALSQQRGDKDAVTQQQTELLQKQTSIYEQQKSLREYLHQLDRDSLALLESQIKLEATRTGAINDPIKAKQAEIEATRRALAENAKELSDAPDEAARLKLQEQRNGLLGEEITKQRELVTLDFQRRQSETDLAAARAKADLQIRNMGDDAVATAQLDLEIDRKKLKDKQDEIALAEKQGKGQAEINALKAQEADLTGQIAEQERKVAEAQRERGRLIDALSQSQRRLSIEAQGGVEGPQRLVASLEAVTTTRKKTAEAQKEYERISGEVNKAVANGEEVSSGTIQKLTTAQDNLTNSIKNQRQAFQELASTYSEQLNNIEAVRSAIEALNKTVYGESDKSKAYFDKNREIDRYQGIEKIRNEARKELDALIKSANDVSKEIQAYLNIGDETNANRLKGVLNEQMSRISKYTQALNSSEKRLHDQADALAKHGVHFTVDDTAVENTLDALDKLSLSNDQRTPEIMGKKDEAETMATAAFTYKDTTSNLAKIMNGFKDDVESLKQVTSSSSSSTSQSSDQKPTEQRRALTPEEIKEQWARAARNGDSVKDASGKVLFSALAEYKKRYGELPALPSIKPADVDAAMKAKLAQAIPSLPSTSTPAAAQSVNQSRSYTDNSQTTVQFQIYDATDPNKVAAVVEKKLSDIQDAARRRRQFEGGCC